MMRLSSSLSVLFVYPLPPPAGGIATWSEVLLRTSQGNDDVTVYHVDTACRWRPPGMPSLGARLLTGGVQAIRDCHRIWAALKTFEPEVLHLTSSCSLSLFRDRLIVAMASRRRVPCVFHIHMGRIPMVRKHASWEWRALCNVVGSSAMTLVLDERSKLVLDSAGFAGRVGKMPNLISLDQIPEKSFDDSTSSRLGREVRIVFVGWVIPTKGVFELVRTWARPEFLNTTLTLVGPCAADIRNHLMSIAHSGGMGGRLSIVGEVSRGRAMDYISGADIFILPSHTEGFPNVVLEAMAMGKAIIATSVGAIPEMLFPVGGEACGVLVPVQDEAALKAAMERLLLDNHERRSLGMRARMRVAKEYALPVVWTRLKGVWKACGGANSSRQSI